MNERDVKRFRGRKKYFYDRLSAPKQKAYRILYQAVCERKREAKLPLGGVEEVKIVITALRYDFPDLIFVDFSRAISVMWNTVPVEFEIPYCFPLKECEKKQQFFEQKCRKVVNKLQKKYKGDFPLEVMLYAWIIRNVEYGTAPQEMWKGQTAYEAMILGRAVCHGIAALFKVLADMAGIEETLIVSGKMRSGHNPKGESHSWNIVKIQGKYAHLDVTNDGFFIETPENTKVKYPCGIWMNVTDKEARKRYKWDTEFFPSCHSPEVSYCAMLGNVARTEEEILKMIQKCVRSKRRYFTIRLAETGEWEKPEPELVLKVLRRTWTGTSHITYVWDEMLSIMSVMFTNK
ncbi:MAG: transglutaminase domain-containing protein [bacterium]|nr:transglutaminase domain-containing protein [bacterium]